MEYLIFLFIYVDSFLAWTADCSLFYWHLIILLPLPTGVPIGKRLSAFLSEVKIAFGTWQGRSNDCWVNICWDSVLTC